MGTIIEIFENLYRRENEKLLRTSYFLPLISKVWLGNVPADVSIPVAPEKCVLDGPVMKGFVLGLVLLHHLSKVLRAERSQVNTLIFDL